MLHQVSFPQPVINLSYTASPGREDSLARQVHVQLQASFIASRILVADDDKLFLWHTLLAVQNSGTSSSHLRMRFGLGYNISTMVSLAVRLDCLSGYHSLSKSCGKLSSSIVELPKPQSILAAKILLCLCRQTPSLLSFLCWLHFLRRL